MIRTKLKTIIILFQISILIAACSHWKDDKLIDEISEVTKSSLPETCILLVISEQNCYNCYTKWLEKADKNTIGIAVSSNLNFYKNLKENYPKIEWHYTESTNIHRIINNEIKPFGPFKIQIKDSEILNVE